jgi:CheY-like chemotaxis protein
VTNGVNGRVSINACSNWNASFTTKELGRGTGLGLATVSGIVKQHKGFINVHNEPGEGTTFWIYFPATAGKPEQQKAISTGSTPKGNESVLVSDDHDGLRAIAEESLTSYGYKVVLATNGTEAVRIFSQRQNEIQLVILDVTMPLLRGPQAYAQMSELKPAGRLHQRPHRGVIAAWTVAEERRSLPAKALFTKRAWPCRATLDRQDWLVTNAAIISPPPCTTLAAFITSALDRTFSAPVKFSRAENLAKKISTKRILLC